MTNRIKAILTALLILSAMCATAAADLPATFDWRDVNGTNYVTPVKNQEMCGSCGIHSSCAIIESNILIENDYMRAGGVDLSEQYYVSDCWGLMDCDTVDPSARDMVLTHAQLSGVLSEECVPYLGSNSPCYRCDEWDLNLWFITNLSSASYATDSLKSTIIEHGPVSGTMYAGTYWYDPVMMHHSHHSVVIVGWDDSVGPGCWIVKNSWGTWFGDGGYGMVAYTTSGLHNIRDIRWVGGSYNPNYGPCDAYDTNGEPGIQKPEMVNAMNDYLFLEIISQETMAAVLTCYLFPDL